MKKFLLQNSLGHVAADAVVQEVIRVYEDAFPGRIAGYYVEGSYADRTYMATSDIDMTIVFSNHLAHEDVRKAAEDLWATSAHASTMEVDITVVDEDKLHEGVYPTLKVGSQLIYGQDVCSKYPNSLYTISTGATSLNRAGMCVLRHMATGTTSAR